MKIGIVGAGENKFSPETARTTQLEIFTLLYPRDVTCLVSGHSPVGGVDIWAEKIAHNMKLELDIKTPRQNSWDGEYGFKARNIDIAKSSDEIHVFVIDKLPSTYHGRKFDGCYHCDKHQHDIAPHVKSGGCWTAWKAVEYGKQAFWHVIKQE